MGASSNFVSGNQFKKYAILGLKCGDFVRLFWRRQLNQVIKMAEWCAENMRTPRMMHFICELDTEGYEVFISRRFCQNFRRQFIRELKQYDAEERLHLLNRRKRKLPPFHMIYSIEAKYLNKTDPQPYIHIHILLFIDILHKAYNAKEISIMATKALSSIRGIKSLYFDHDNKVFIDQNKKLASGFLKYRVDNPKVLGTIKNHNWHDLKTELDDAICRASYLCKTEQKVYLPPELNRNNSFGHTRIIRVHKRR